MRKRKEVHIIDEESPPRTRVTVLVPSKRGERALLGVAGINVVRLSPSDPLSEEARAAEVMIVGHTGVDATLARIRELPRLRLVQTLAHGSDQWEGQLPDGVALSTARGAHGGSTAEWVVAALLAIMRQIPTFAKEQGEHRWQPRVTRTLLGTKTLVLGAGDVGVNVRDRLTPFGTSVTLVGTHPREGVIGLGQVPELLPKTRVLVVVLPLTEATHHLVDADLLAALPDGAIVVNAGRGGARRLRGPARRVAAGPSACGP